MEFHAVIFCGPGTNLSPFSRTRETGQAKAALPIANRAMIEYVLEWCEQAPFPRVTVVCDGESQAEMQLLVEQYLARAQSKSLVEVAKFDGEATGGVLEQLSVQASNLVLLPCDFLTDLPPQVLIEEYRNKDEHDVGMSVHYKNKFENIDKKHLTNYYTVYSEDGHLLDIYSKESVEASKAIEIRTQLVWRFPNSTVSTKLLDSAIYFVSTHILEQLKHDKYDFKRPVTKVVRDLARRSWKHAVKKGGIAFLEVPAQANFIRSDNTTAYLEANRYLMKLQAKQLQQPQAKEKGAATVGADSQVGENTTLGERTSVKKTVVGNGCAIGKKCRLTGCVLLDGVVLHDEVVLENCIVGRNAVVQAKARLTNCNVEGSYTVSRGLQLKGETLTNIFIEGHDSSSDDDSADDSDYNSYEYDEFDDDDDDGLFER